MPAYVYAIVAIVVGCLGVAAVLRIRTAIRHARSREVLTRKT